MSSIDVGTMLPTAMEDLGDPAVPSVVDAARAVEESGLESLWVADLVLGDGTEALDPTLTLAAAAAVTRRVRLGFGVLALPPRPPAPLASQVATLQHLSGNRIMLGVGIGGFPESPMWRALGVSTRRRGRAVDAALDVLPPLVEGETVHLPDTGADVQLAPATPMPPVLIGGTEHAFERVLRTGADWFPSDLSPDSVGPAVERLRTMAESRGLPRPSVTVGGHLILGEGSAAREARAAFVRSLIDDGIPEEEAERAPMLARTPEELAARYVALADVGADRVVGTADAMGWYEQLDFIAQARTLLPA